MTDRIKVTCDETNNPPEQIAQGRITVDIEIDLRCTACGELVKYAGARYCPACFRALVLPWEPTKIDV